MTYFLPGEEFKLRFSNPVSLTLRRGMTEIVLSLVFSLAIIGCLLYLLAIINRQKKVDEIRNDLIANITHEFKTPITTVVSAIEGIRSFNDNNDKEKTERYLDISERQMKKLQGMVEKLLETATLDTNALVLQKEQIDLVGLLDTITEKYLVGNEAKVVAWVSAIEPVTIQADAFHLENAVSNVVDNAVKYGGRHIGIKLEANNDEVTIFIEDDGEGIDSWHRERIFEKFYRIPKGNIHDVKGFGIGLYYSRKIIEKHGGSLTLESSKKTVFKITLPYA